MSTLTVDALSVTHQVVDLPTGLRMHFVAKGDERAPVVLLLHGFPETWWSWRHQIEPLAAAGYRVIAPDLRGYGETGTQGPYDLDTIVSDVCALLDTLGAKPARVVGHDWGGATAWHLASTRAEYCERLAVLNCPHPVLMRNAMVRGLKWRQLKKSWYMFFFQVPWLPEFLLTRNDAGEVVRMLRGVSVNKQHFSAEELRPFRDAIQRPGHAKAMVGWYRAAIRDGLRREPVMPTPYPGPAVLIWGLRDPALSFDDVVPGTEQMAPRLRVERLENAGHFVHAEQPEAVNERLLRFLAEAN